MRELNKQLFDHFVLLRYEVILPHQLQIVVALDHLCQNIQHFLQVTQEGMEDNLTSVDVLSKQLTDPR